MGYSFDYKYFKYLAAVSGFYFGGIIGGISAFLLVRELVDNKDRGVDVLELSLLRLSSLMIKADGRIDKEEVKTVRNFFYKELKKNPPIPNNLDEILAVIKSRLQPNKLYSIIQFLYTIAIADGHLAVSEDEFIFKVGRELGFTKNRLQEIRNLFVESTKSSNNDDSLKTSYLMKLGLDPKASKDEIKKAFRSLAKEYHPDKLVGVNQTIKKIAEDKFREIREAYDYLIKA